MSDAYQINARDALPEVNAVRPEKIDLFWEDFQPGHSFACGQRKVTKEEIVGFANQYDPQPFHLDEAFCAGTIYGGLIASGGHVWAICMGLVVRSVFNRSANMGSPGLDYLRWHRPLRPGDLVRAVVTVVSAEPSSRPLTGKLKLSFELRNHREEVLMSALVNVLMGRNTNV
ncbi:MaoC/PaaZ C-terminal domain-containing protein [Paraburkholderia phytofirmans]|uniref:MaoC/PaaZ C-terminal domain-containing protein n=1 Tax=Paraburkholderia phytofirmans TaxID=261302 RepID=UPI0009ECF34C|nr:MaoC/PaaZ C-terminal domain-containing protein [Paraburkholderia phytofirmans]